MGNNTSTTASSSQVSMADFESLQVIGQGAFGKVCMVKQVHRQENYALKVISKAHCVKTNRIRHVVRERMLLEQLDHPLVCNLRYAFQDEHNIYMAMDLMLGGDLRRCIDQNGPLPESLTRFWMSELICAVKYLHSKGIMHRDIKPENLLLHSDGHLHLTDFNIATRIRHPYDGLLTSQSGTLVYFAPEMVKGYGYTEDVDWWGVGITFYECIYGKRPWREHEGKDSILHQIVRGHIPYPMLANGNITLACQSVIQGFLEINPMYRLGHDTTGWEQLLQHPFFSGTRWQEINGKRGTPSCSINLQHYISSPTSLTLNHTKNDTTIIPPVAKDKSELLQLSTIVSSSAMTSLPALSKPTHCASSISSYTCKDNYNAQQQNERSDRNDNEGWLAAAYDYFLAPSPTKPENRHHYDDAMKGERYIQQLQELETAFTLFDWTVYDDYQGFMDKTTLSVGAPPSWVKPAFNDANNGRILPMPTISTNLPLGAATSTICDDDALMTPPTTPTSATFFPTLAPYEDNNEISGYPLEPKHIPSPPPQLLHHHQALLKKQRRRSNTKQFNERRDWERRKSMGTAVKLANIG